MKKGRSDRPETSLPEMLTVSEVAERTNMSIAFWRREVRLKRIPVTYFGRAVRISDADLDAYMAQRRAAKRR